MYLFSSNSFRSLFRFHICFLIRKPQYVENVWINICSNKLLIPLTFFILEDSFIDSLVWKFIVCIHIRTIYIFTKHIEWSAIHDSKRGQEYSISIFFVFRINFFLKLEKFSTSGISYLFFIGIIVSIRIPFYYIFLEYLE